MIIRILEVQTKTNLTLWAFMKVVLRMELTMLTEFPITSNLAIRTTERIMKYVLLKHSQNLPE